MSHVLFAYIAKPSSMRIRAFLHTLANDGVAITHLDKRDPPSKFVGTIEEAVSIIIGGSDTTNYTFARSKPRKLDFDFQIQNDERWLHSTLAATSSDETILKSLAAKAQSAFKLFLAIIGDSESGKDQPWNVYCRAENCPSELLTTFVAK